MVAAGAIFVGPLGISLVWAIYHAISPWLLLWYSILPFEHEIGKEHKRWWYLFGRNTFDILCHVAFVATFACFILAFVIAVRTSHNAGGDTSAVYQTDTSSTPYHYTVAHTFYCLRHSCPQIPTPAPS